MSRAHSLPTRPPPPWHGAPHDPPPPAHRVPARSPQPIGGVIGNVTPTALVTMSHSDDSDDDGHTTPFLHAHTLRSAHRLAMLHHSRIPAMPDVFQDDHDDQYTTDTLTPDDPQCRPLLSDPSLCTSPPLKHNLDLIRNDNDAYIRASRRANAAAGSAVRRQRHQRLTNVVGSSDHTAPLPRTHVATLHGQLLYRNGAEPRDLRWTIAFYPHNHNQRRPELSGASLPVSGDPRAPPFAISGSWNPTESSCVLLLRRDTSTCTHNMQGEMRWTPAGLVIVGTWAHDASEDATTATAALGEFSCCEEPPPPHRQAATHPAGLWNNIHIPSLGSPTPQHPLTKCHLVAHIDTTLDHWYVRRLQPRCRDPLL